MENMNDQRASIIVFLKNIYPVVLSFNIPKYGGERLYIFDVDSDQISKYSVYLTIRILKKIRKIKRGVSLHTTLYYLEVCSAYVI